MLDALNTQLRANQTDLKAALAAGKQREQEQAAQIQDLQEQARFFLGQRSRVSLEAMRIDSRHLHGRTSTKRLGFGQRAYCLPTCNHTASPGRWSYLDVHLHTA